MSLAEWSQASSDKRERLGMNRRFSESRDVAELRSDGTTADPRGRAPADALHGVRSSLQPGLRHCVRQQLRPGQRPEGQGAVSPPSRAAHSPSSFVIFALSYIKPPQLGRRGWKVPEVSWPSPPRVSPPACSHHLSEIDTYL